MFEESTLNTLSWLLILALSGLLITGAVQLARRGNRDARRIPMKRTGQTVLLLIAVFVFLAQVLTVR